MCPDLVGGDHEPIDGNGFLARRVAQALEMSPDERFRAGAELFDYACATARAGIAAALQTPDEQEIDTRLRARLRLQEALDERVPQ